MQATIGLCVVAEFEKRQHEADAEKTTVAKIMQKADSNSSAGASADSSTKDDATFISSNDAKPNVVGIPDESIWSGITEVLPSSVFWQRPVSFTKADLSTQEKVDQVLNELSGLSIGEANRILRISSNCVFALSEKALSGILV